ncbi:UDP-4-amino-4,6-dideoxy-N-acetyl-beta-L-altrosamine N-acetyltransferase [Paenibacillus alginolyticus]|uniref:UDP-4-amino-4, 6-dideoxy-N-acetyl-beta-L-altrosamine N-acetyltransferase n=1 Tax=Paenibacillus alginolyticus TaxID=59839 RepID=A0ABT4G854_9BACL|nr:UDP-4-amino-4,6-dideoxy-N-acetyl-beta-L-altrosamine N-acetyltransferase [Paenibacillus alginolyticus]MCY9692372.1 UDP-4-amino-4,6-dideoxy-N-acetyl-beta-L-altrosamine N-acetyltransferase [Paenibacillus alginolyticus]MEC0143655.1 UDP-4-amino-4,6-dideoxy-N-acetyl-beta-L-altrosamine N-acetyltransferase [Paenibacillus alginolyticus]
MESDGRLRSINETDLRTVFDWRNSDRIRGVMLDNKPIHWEQHCKWFDKIKDSIDDVVLVFEFINRPVGLVQFNKLQSAHQTAHWGFYLGETDLPSGTGSLLGKLALQHYFDELGMRKLYAEVLQTNIISNHFHIKLGFTEEGRLRKHVSRDQNYEDLIIYGLFDDEWRDKL